MSGWHDQAVGRRPAGGVEEMILILLKDKILNRSNYVNCPKCGNRPLTFSKFMRTLNPFRIQCSHCNAHLEAGFMAYLWTLCHIPIAAGLAWVGAQAGLFTSSWGIVGFC